MFWVLSNCRIILPNSWADPTGLLHVAFSFFDTRLWSMLSTVKFVSYAYHHRLLRLCYRFVAFDHRCGGDAGILAYRLRLECGKYLAQIDLSTLTTKQSRNFLDSLSSGTTARSTGDSELMSSICQELEYWTGVSWGAMILLCHVFREVIPCLRASDPKSSAINSRQSAGRHYQAIGDDRTQRSSTG